MTSVRSKYLVTAKDDIAVYDSWTLRPEDVGADHTNILSYYTNVLNGAYYLPVVSSPIIVLF